MRLIFIKLIDFLLLGITTIVFGVVIYLLINNLNEQTNIYKNGINEVYLSKDSNAPIIALAYSKAYDYALVKTSCIFIGFILVILGVYFLFKIFNANFRMQVEMTSQLKFNIVSPTPGLVLSSLGTLIILVALIMKSDIIVDKYSQVLNTDNLSISPGVFINDSTETSATNSKDRIERKKNVKPEIYSEESVNDIKLWGYIFDTKSGLTEEAKIELNRLIKVGKLSHVEILTYCGKCNYLQNSAVSLEVLQYITSKLRSSEYISVRGYGEEAPFTSIVDSIIFIKK